MKHFNHARNKEIIDSLLAKIAELEAEINYLKGNTMDLEEEILSLECDLANGDQR